MPTRPPRWYYEAKRDSSCKVLEYLIGFIIGVILFAALVNAFIWAIDHSVQHQRNDLTPAQRAAVVASWGK
jgi:hypothetical protein